LANKKASPPESKNSSSIEFYFKKTGKYLDPHQLSKAFNSLSHFTFYEEIDGPLALQTA
jgi:hypothetical protein